MIFVLGLYSVACAIALWLSVKARFHGGVIASLVIVLANLGTVAGDAPLFWRVYGAPITILLATSATHAAFGAADRERRDNELQERFNRVGYALAGVAVLEAALALIGGFAHYAATRSPF